MMTTDETCLYNYDLETKQQLVLGVDKKNLTASPYLKLKLKNLEGKLCLYFSWIFVVCSLFTKYPKEI